MDILKNHLLEKIKIICGYIHFSMIFEKEIHWLMKMLRKPYFLENMSFKFKSQQLERETQNSAENTAGAF